MRLGVGTLYGQRMDTPQTRKNGRVPETTIRSVRVDDDLWARVQDKAKDRRESVADVIRRALLAYVEES